MFYNARERDDKILDIINAMALSNDKVLGIIEKLALKVGELELKLALGKKDN